MVMAALLVLAVVLFVIGFLSAAKFLLILAAAVAILALIVPARRRY